MEFNKEWSRYFYKMEDKANDNLKSDDGLEMKSNIHSEGINSKASDFNKRFNV